MQSRINRRQRTAYIGLNNQVEFVNLIGTHIGKHVFELGSLLTRHTLLTSLSLTRFSNFFGFALIGNYEEFIASFRRFVEAQYLYWNRWTCFKGRLFGFVSHGANLTYALTG